jgi:hypothetical protein
MKAALPQERTRALAAFNRLEIANLNGYLKGIAALDRGLAAECLKAAIPALQAAFEVAEPILQAGAIESRCTGRSRPSRNNSATALNAVTNAGVLV